MKNPAQTGSGCIRFNDWNFDIGTCFIQKLYAPSSSLLQGKHLPFSPSPLRLNIFCLFVILLLTQLYRYTPAIFLLFCYMAVKFEVILTRLPHGLEMETFQ
jgi:hypothetical protein